MSTDWTARRSSYRIRLLATFAGPWLLTVIFSFIYVSRLQTSTGESSARQHLGIVSDMLAFSVASGLSNADFSMVQKAFEWSRFDENVVYIGIADEQDEIIFQTKTSAPLPLDRLANEPPGISSTDAGLLSITPVTDGGRKLGTVVLLYSLAGVERNVRSAQLTSMVVSLLVLLVGLWGTRLLARQAGELESARAEAERQATTVRAQADVLARTNGDLEKSYHELHNAQTQLQQAHDELELRVRDRTIELAAAIDELRLNQGHLDVALMVARMSPWKVDLTTRQLIVSPDLLDRIGETTTKISRLLTFVHREDRSLALSEFRKAVSTLDPLEVEFRVNLKKGDIAWNACYGRAIRGADGTPTHVVGIIMDITDRKRAEDALRTSLREKEILLKEVHHRVKNNMQVISSLLSLQSAHVRDSQDAELFLESQLRVKSMAIVHERLYQSRDLSSIDFGDYVETIASDLKGSYHLEGVNIRTEIESLRFGVDTAIPCGLLINELVTNSIKHAFPDGRKGTIEIAATRNHDNVTLVVSDDGVGVPDGLNLNSETTLGVMLIQALTDQLSGTISVDGSNGTRIAIEFPLIEQPPLLG
jgi:PAS domain S-box-containing protein